MKTKITIVVMLLVTFLSFAQKKWEPYHQLSLDAGYTFSSLKENQNPNQPLFAGNGVNFGVSHRWGDNIGIASRIGFMTGSIDQAGIQSITEKWPTPPRYLPNPKEKNYSQISLMTGPSIKLGKKHQFEINALGGIGFNPSPNTIRVDSYEQDVFLETVYEAKDKSVVGMWQVNAKINLTKITNNLGLSLNAGYGTNGGTIGVSFAVYHCELCRCCKPCPFGCEDKTKGSKGK